MKHTLPHIDKLQRFWVRQLELEFDEICASRGLSLPSPTFALSTTTSRLGCWDGATRTITLSSRLILEASWSVTLQVLKHEMAHMLCGDRTPLAKSPHGPGFQEACEILGVLPEFRRPQTVLPETVAMGTAGSAISAEGRKCIAKIEKLFALARSANEHEADLAMRKANELIEKYHLQGLEAGREQHHTFTVIEIKKKRIERYQSHICSILQQFFFVRVVLSHLYNPLANDTYRTIELFGTGENVTIAEYCYFFLENQLAMLWSQNRHLFKGNTRQEKSSYYLGLLFGFQERLQEQSGDRVHISPEPGRTGALVLAANQRLDHYVSIHHPHLRTRKSQGAKVFPGTYAAGAAAGRTITFTHGLTEQDSAFGGLLPPGKQGKR